MRRSELSVLARFFDRTARRRAAGGKRGLLDARGWGAREAAVHARHPRGHRDIAAGSATVLAACERSVTRAHWDTAPGSAGRRRDAAALDEGTQPLATASARCPFMAPATITLTGRRTPPTIAPDP